MSSIGTGGMPPLRISNDGPRAPTPPQFFVNRNRRPDPNGKDFQNFDLGCYWLYWPRTNPDLQEVWQLVSLQLVNGQMFGKWVIIATGAGGNIVAINTDNGLAQPINGIIDILGQPQAGKTVTFTSLPSATTNIVRLNVTDAADNTTIGLNSGTGITTSQNTTAFGSGALQFLSTGNGNTGLGVGAGLILTSGFNNTFVGSVVSNFLPGPASNNTILGALSGISLTSTESNNVLINSGGVTADQNTLRIGESTGTGAFELNKAAISGIYQRPFSTTNGVVFVDSTNVLGSSNGTNGQLLIGGGTGPTWGNITSDGSITITNGPNTIAVSVTNPIPAGLSYSTGSFVPELTFGGANVGLTYTSRSGTYTQIGNRCFITLSMQLSNKGSSTGAARVTGLPFPANPAANVNNDIALYLGDSPNSLTLSTGYTWGWATVFTSGSPNQCELREGNPTLPGSDDIQDTNFANNSGFTLAGSYVI